MKVLIITTSYPDHAGSNRGVFVRRLCQEINRQGLEVLVLTPRIYRESPLFQDDGGIRVHRFRFPSKETPLNQTEGIPIFPMLIYMTSGFFKAVRLILREKPDVIHGNWIVPTGLIAALAGFLIHVPVINTARGMDMRISERGPVRHLFDLAVRLSNKVTVVSEAMKTRASLKDAEVFSSGVDEEFFEISPDYTSKTVLYTRSFEPVYDAQTLIKCIPLVVEKVPRARFIIAGTGSQESELKDLAQSLDISRHVEFPGLVPNKDVVSLMKKASVYVSTATADGTSIALLEAMAAGLIPIATDIETNRNLIRHEKDGFLFKPKDEKDLADKLFSALTVKIPEGTLEEKKSELRDTIYWSNIAKKFIALYTQILE